MAGARIRVEADAALAALGRAAAQTASPRGLYDAIGAAMVVSTQMRFERQGGPDGSPWPPSIRAMVAGGKTLIDSARLLQSITHQADAAGVDIGTNAIYAAVHQFGATIRATTARALRFELPGIGWVMRRSVRIPARPFLGLDAADEAEIMAIAGDWLLRDSGAAP